MKSKLGLSVALGLLIGGAIGLLIGFLTKQYAIWPTLCIGAGLIGGIITGIILDRNRK